MTQQLIHILLGSQTLELLERGQVVIRYPISSSAYGEGEASDSRMTPRGRHKVAARIGEGQPKGAVFVSRRATGEIYTRQLGEVEPDRDWILSRILWLRGLEPGLNQGGRVDTESRYIYIHGTPEEDKIGQPASHGCIRMRNDDVIDLFGRVRTGTLVEIIESSAELQG